MDKINDSFNEDGDISKVHVVLKRTRSKAHGPLFGAVYTYKATITIWDDSGIHWREYEKDYGRTSFSKINQDLEVSKKGWIAKGMKPDQITIDYTNSKPS